jgi:NAD(P)-dependent dehydrogenase (short-subunit alcohol dehydrogenase family)
LIVDRHADDTRATAERIQSEVPGAMVVDAAFDLAQEASAADAVRGVTEAFGRVDILVNNAGIRAYEPLAKAQSETWHRTIAVKLLSYAYLAREAIPAGCEAAS